MLFCNRLLQQHKRTPFVEANVWNLQNHRRSHFKKTKLFIIHHIETTLAYAREFVKFAPKIGSITSKMSHCLNIDVDIYHLM